MDIVERNNLVSAFVGNTTHHTEPFIDIFYPITYFSDKKGAKENTGDDVKQIATNKVVGVVSVTLYWRDILKNLPPGGIDGMQVVIENTCNQTFTYTWSESELFYLGEGDVHEGGFDDQVMSFSLAEGGMYSVGQSDANDCQYTIHMYPSTAMFVIFKKTEPK